MKLNTTVFQLEKEEKKKRHEATTTTTTTTKRSLRSNKIILAASLKSHKKFQKISLVNVQVLNLFY